MPPLARTFILGEVVPPASDWSRPALQFVTDAVVGATCRALVTHRVRGHSFVRLYKGDSREPLSHDMVQCGFAVAGYPSLEGVPPGPDLQQGVAPPPQHSMPLSVVVPAVPPPALYQAAVSPLPRALVRPMHLEIGTWYRWGQGYTALIFIVL